jgi:regulatory protein
MSVLETELFWIMTGKITGLKVQTKNHQRVNVYLDGDFAFGLRRIVAAWLSIGQELSDEKIAKLKAEDGREEAYQRAMRFLEIRPRSTHEGRQQLEKHAIPEDLIAETISRLANNGLLNDVSFAKLWVDNRSEFRPRGRRALAFELRRQGVDSQILDEALNSLDEEALALAAARKQSRRLAGLEWQEFRMKLSGFMARRGFDYQTTSVAISQVWEELHSGTENKELLDEEEDLE